MNILFLTDSLGYPRVEPEETSAKDIWTYNIRDRYKSSLRNDVSFFFDMKAGRDTSTLLFDVDQHVISYLPDIIVLQVGIVDCYPRSLTKTEQQILTRIPIIRKVTKFLVKKYYTSIIKFRNIAYVDHSDFQDNLVILKSKFPLVNWVVLPIAPPTSRYQEKNPLVRDRIEMYNSSLERIFGSSFLHGLYKDSDVERLFLADHHHLSRYGHELVSAYVFDTLSNLSE